MIDWLKSKQKKGQPIRSDGPASHIITKQGTPTMGGLLIIIATIISVLLWADISSGYVWVVIFVCIGFGMIGGVDDYMKLRNGSSSGAGGKLKLLLEIIIAAIAVIWIIYLANDEYSTQLAITFFKNVFLPLSYLFIPFAIIVIAGTGNAVNLTDGLDGLAIVPTIFAFGTFSIIAYLVGNIVFANYLQIHFVPQAGELAIFGGAIIGAGLGFLWFNAPPAMVFMGDTGSLALGGALGTIAIIVKHEIVLLIVGGLFVLETISVIVQVISFRLTGRRIFKMAPLHHHFEHKGWPEATIVIRFWIIAAILSLLGLATMKLR